MLFRSVHVVIEKPYFVIYYSVTSHFLDDIMYIIVQGWCTRCGRSRDIYNTVIQTQHDNNDGSEL